MTEPYSPSYEQSIQPVELSDPEVPRRVSPRQLAYGIALSTVAMFGIGLTASGDSGIINHDLAYVTNNAQPSDGLAHDFELLENAGEALGLAFLLKRSAHHLRLAFSPEDEALYKLVPEQARHNKHRIVRTISAASFIATGAGIMTGNFIDIAKAESKAQASVAANFGEELNRLPARPGAKDYLLTSTQYPVLSNDSFLSAKAVSSIEKTAQKQDVAVVPIYGGWYNGNREDSKANLPLYALGLPNTMTNLPATANQDCQTINVEAAQELGVEVGHSFMMDNLKLTVRAKLTGDAGLDLLPVIMNEKDFADCVDENPGIPHNMLLTRATKTQVERLLQEAGIEPGNLSERVFTTPLTQFLDNTEQSGKNSVDGLVLEAMAVGLIFAGAALNSKARNQLLNNRSRLEKFKKLGFDEHKVARLFAEKSESEMLRSSLLAMPAVYLIDAYTNNGEPGAALGPDIKTFLCVLGLGWAAGRLNTTRAVRNEARHTRCLKEGRDHE